MVRVLLEQRARGQSSGCFLVETPYTLGSCVSEDLQIQRDFSLRQQKTQLNPRSRKVGILNKVRRFFSPQHLCLFYNTQVCSCLECSSPLWYGATQFLLDILDWLQRRANRIVNSPEFTEALEPLYKYRLLNNPLSPLSWIVF